MKKQLSEMTLEELWQLFPIILTPHNPDWADWYDEERLRLEAFLPMKKIVRASHIGSTAIPSIWAKPTVDILVETDDPAALKEPLRAAGYGLGGILTATGVGTVVEEGKRKLEVDGRDYLLELPLHADFALVEAFLADYLGNLTYALTARNFNPVIAMAADTVIVDAEHVVPVGMIPPDNVMTPCVLVDYLIARA
jgi:acetate CoA/acetoacetate CoA-transferase alpha subunit